MKTGDWIQLGILIFAIITTTITSFLSLQNIEISKENTELTKNLTEKAPDFSIVLPTVLKEPNSSRAVFYHTFCIRKNYYELSDNITLINTGYRPVLLSDEHGKIFEVCPNRTAQIGFIYFYYNNRILEVDKTLNLEYLILSGSAFVSNNCSIVFNVASQDGKVNKNESYNNVNIINC